MIHIFDLDNDIFLSICGLLTTSDLRTLSTLSRIGFQMTIPALVRIVTLSRSPRQVLDFCNFCTKYDIEDCIISLVVCESAAYFEPPKKFVSGYTRGIDNPQSAVFAGALAEVLERAENLAHLAFQYCTDLLLESEPRIANIVCQRPPALSLELSGADASFLRRFSTVARLTYLKLQTSSPPEYCGEEEEAVEAIVVNSISTLDTLSLGHAVPKSLRSELPPSFSCDHVRHFSVFGSSVLPEKVAVMFPNIQSLEIKHTTAWVVKEFNGRKVQLPPLVHFDCPSKTLWTNLRSFSGPKQLALNLSRHHSLRRISFKGYEPYTDASEFTQLSETLLNSDIRSLCLDVELFGKSDARNAHWLAIDLSPIDDLPPLLIPLFSNLKAAANHLTYLSLHIGRNSLEIPFSLRQLIRTASLLAPLNDLKYVELGVMTWLGSVPSILYTPEVSTKPEEIVRAWVEGVPSLQYLELNVVHKDWEHCWWRIEPQDRTFRRVSKEEGLSTKNWFDLEEWK